jgi:DNA polymerase I-like protein with 3'-5' exonuclease and polymerase domains
MQLSFFMPASDWRPPAMEDLPDWKDAKRIAIDCETYDPYLKTLGPSVRRGGYVVGVSFAIEDGPEFYLPFRHLGGDNLDEQNVLHYLRMQAGSFKGDLVGANLPYDLDYLAEEQIEFGSVRWFRDIQVADPLIYELQQSFSLKNIGLRYGIEAKDENLLLEAARALGVSAKSGLHKLPAKYVGPYATRDVTAPLQISRLQERRIEDKGLWDIYNLESQVLPVLVKLRRRGVRIDMDKLEEIETWTLKQEAEALDVVKRETGVAINVGDVWKNETLVPALESIGMRLAKTSTGKKSVNQDAFASMDHPVTNALAYARKVNKLRTTFAASIRRYQVKGRIHCTFNQIAREDERGDQKGVRYGRLSCVEPNLQQQPSRDEYASLWRSIYLPEEGAQWATCDYSQQEPRWTTHYAAELDLPKARQAAQAYHDNPDLDNHQFMAELTGVPRKEAKCIYLGLCYGEGGAKLCDDLGLPTRWACSTGGRGHREITYFEEREGALEFKRDAGGSMVWRAAGKDGQSIINQFDERAPFIRQLATQSQRQAQKKGFLRTGGGRILNFPQLQDGNYDWTHKALNRLIQGTSADQTKKAMVEIDKAGHWMMLQVHDETDHSVQDRKEAEAIAEIMEGVMPARVPFKVDIEIGRSWGEAE